MLCLLCQTETENNNDEMINNSNVIRSLASLHSSQPYPSPASGRLTKQASMSRFDPGPVGYTPELSDELYSLIIDSYKSDIKPILNDLKLHKMLDLIEIAEYEFENYQKHLISKDFKTCLKYYIMGMFYIYLIIPNSIQFQIKNKNYEVFLFLKHLFEKEVNMGNVKKLSIKYIGALNDLNLNDEIIKTRSKRSNTVPASLVHKKSINQNEKEETSSSSSSSSSNSSIVEDLWSSPDLQPNDQLKLILDNFSSDSLNKIPDLPPHPPPPPPISYVQESPSRDGSNQDGAIQDGAPKFTLRHANTIPSDFQSSKIDQELESSPPKVRIRADSHQSIYVNEEDEDYLNIPLINSKDLFNELITNETFMIIFDLRRIESFNINHIDYDNIINIDPSLLKNVEDYQGLYDSLKISLTDSTFSKFKNLRSFEKCLIYTDDKNFFSFKFDYLLKFNDLINSKNSIILKGGFDSWIKFISKNHSNELNKFKSRRNLIAQPPSIPPPSPPKQPAPYDYSKFLPQYTQSQSSQIQSNHTISKISHPPHPTQICNNSYNGFTNIPTQINQAYPIDYQRPPHPLPQHPINSIPENHSQQFPQQPLHYPSSSAIFPQPHNLHFRQAPMISRTRSDSVPILQNSENPYIKLSVTGLRNMGNTCYINSMIQCLFATTKFRDIFLDNKFEKYINPNFNRSKLSFALSTLFKKMYLNGGCSIIPSGFLKKCVEIRPDLKIPTEQQDTQEFLMFLSDHLHDELSNSNNVVEDYPDLMSFNSNLGDEYLKWFDNLIKQGFSPISKFFQGQLKDSLRCCKCGFESSNFSTFYMLSLVIPKISKSGKKLKKINLEDCIELFTNEEILTGENAWDCPKCSKAASSTASKSSLSLSDGIKEPRKHRLHGLGRFRNRSASPSTSNSKTPSSMSNRKSTSKSIKSLNFLKLPPILIIHLSRFLFYDLSSKDDSIVQYPIILKFSIGSEIVKYKLFGVINHFGTLKSGHYTAMTNKSLNHDLDDPNWYYFDDETVKTTNHASSKIKGNHHLSSSNVYVMFYEKIE